MIFVCLFYVKGKQQIHLNFDQTISYRMLCEGHIIKLSPVECLQKGKKSVVWSLIAFTVSMYT